MFFSLLAASVDGFICGFILSGLGVKIRFKEFIISFGVILLCCITASFSGHYIAHTELQRYINIIGVFILLWLTMSALCPESMPSYAGITTASISVAVDASVVCLYLGMAGYNIFMISILCALMHCILMVCANIVSYKLINPDYLKYIRFPAGIFFIISAILKLNNI